MCTLVGPDCSQLSPAARIACAIVARAISIFQGSAVSSSILLIEDNVLNMDYMIFALNALGLSVIPALNGPAGLAIAKTQKPCLILCDIVMAELDGYGVLAALRADPAVRTIPVVAVTAMAMQGDRDRLLAAGFDGYLAKPVSLDDLKREVYQHLL